MSKSRDIADSAATINYIDTVTSNVQTQIDNIDPLPSQTGQSGKFLTTDGSAASWDAVDVSSEITGTLPVANGGTGATTLTANNVLLGNGTSAPLAVAPSTSGNVLTSNGTTWQSTAPAGGGAWEYISTTTASAASTVDITGIDSTYDQYVITAKFTTTQANWIMARFFLGGSIVTTSTYDYIRNTHSSSGTFGSSQASDRDYGQCMYASAGGGANESESFVMYIFDPNTASVARKIYTEHFGTNGSLVSRTNSTISNAGTSALTGIRLYHDSAGETITGTFHLYGIKNS